MLNGDKIFEWIKKDLKKPAGIFPGLDSPNYRIYSFVKKPVDFEKDDPIYLKDENFLIKTEKYGVPQNRHRIILLGIREDVGRINYNPLETQKTINLKDVIGDLPKLRSGIGREIIGANIKGKNSYREIENTEKNWNATVAEYYKKIKNEFEKNKIPLDSLTGLTTGKNYLKFELNEPSNPLINWYFDSNLGGVLNHETRTHLKEDLGRYLFSSLYLKVYNDFPKLKDFPEWLLPNHKNAIGGKFADRFRTQRPNQPATTVTSHISKDGHYFIHYDPAQCRSLTVREAARVQTFPDNFFFCGTRTQQYHQVGNAVPPFLAKQIAEIVYNILCS